MQSYFITHGRGLDSFCLSELEFSAARVGKTLEIIDRIEGKIAFQTDLNLNELLSLKTIERLFMKIEFFKFDNLSMNLNDDTHEKLVLERVENELHLDTESPVFLFILESYNQGTINDREEETAKTKKLKRSYKYRLDIKLTGKWKAGKCFKSLRENLSKIITNKIYSMHSNFEVDLQNPDFVITLHLSDIALAVGIPVTKLTISHRNHEHIGLRSTICSVMWQLAFMNRKSDYLIVMDPFCGKSTILAEVLSSNVSYFDQIHPFFINSDANQKEIENSLQNLTNTKQNKYSYDLIHSNLCNNSCFPYRDGITDLIITDLPFGVNHTQQNFNNSNNFYEKVLEEINRLLESESGVAVILINYNDLVKFEDTLCKLNDLILISNHKISLGVTMGNICVLKKINNHT